MRYYAVFDKLYKENKPVPALTVKKAFSLLTSEKTFQTKILASKIELFKQSLINKVSVKPYVFSYRGKNGTVNLSTMIDYCLAELVDNYYQTINTSQETKKEALAYKIYCSLYKYKINHLNKKYQKTVSHYLLGAITAFILIELGYLPKRGSDTIYKLFHSIDKCLLKEIKIKGLPDHDKPFEFKEWLQLP